MRPNCGRRESIDNLLSLLGLAKKAGKLSLGEEPTGASARARDARLILLAQDAAENSCRRARHFAEAGGVPAAQLPFTKAELGGAFGRTSCAMLSVDDTGFAAAAAAKLAALDAARYGETAAQLRERDEKARRRAAEQRTHDRNRRRGKK